MSEWTIEKSMEAFASQKIQELISEFLSFIGKEIDILQERENVCRMNWDNMRKEGNLVHAQFWWDKANVYEVIIKELKKEKERWEKKKK